MKRTRFDSDYDEIRRAAGFAKPAYEFPDVEEEKLSAERVEAMNADFKERMQALADAERTSDATKRAEFDAWRRDYNIRVIKRQYTDLGLMPPEPLVSLSLLLQFGWKVEQVGDKMTLVRPFLKPTPAKSTDNQMGS